MHPDAHHARRSARSCLLGLGLLVALCAPSGIARAEPPIQSPEDAACRDVARAQVYTAPDPQNLGLREIGRRIYMACMSRMTKPKRVYKVKRKRARRR